MSISADLANKITGTLTDNHRGGITGPAIRDILLQLGDEATSGGGGGGGGVLTGIASQVTGAHKVLYSVPDGSGLAAASSDNLTHTGRIVGVSISAALANAFISYVSSGSVIDEPTWGWAPGPVYLGGDGNPTQTYPTSGFVQQIGTSPSGLPTRIIINIEPFVILA